LSNSTIDTVIIIGAGPAGLTAAYELAIKSDKKIIVFEASDQVGGISKTVDYKGNKIDIGGHRFFSKSDWVLDWWQQFLPIKSDDKEIITTYQNKQKKVQIDRSTDADEYMMIRTRKSRIYYNKHLFDYPLKLSLSTFLGLGIINSFQIVFSLLKIKLSPLKQEKNLEDFFINRFGKKLYQTFFKSYTEKVWGKHCSEISASWGSQRIKTLGIRKIISHYLKSTFIPKKLNLKNKKVEQSLIEYFLYPQKGPGQLWEKVAATCQDKGVEFVFNAKVEGLKMLENTIQEVSVRKSNTNELLSYPCNNVISTMPIKELAIAMQKQLPPSIYTTGANLEYRDFMIVGLLLDDLKLKEKDGSNISDNWLYIQDSSVKVGRVQLFHNWSPFMAAEKGKFWIGAEYFCSEKELLEANEESMIELASKELEKIGLIDSKQVRDGVLVKMPKAYPSYTGCYPDFGQIKEYLDTITNLYPIGRNGMHQYNNQDHSMLTALNAVDSILLNPSSKSKIWDINIEQEYHEEKKVALADVK